jgi:carbon-monoxide dehydrogenase large subunit
MNDEAGQSVLERPNSYIGRSLPRPNVLGLLHGRGTFTDDIRLKRMAHVAFLRSPHAHADIVSMDFTAAKQSPGVFAVAGGEEIAAIYQPWLGVLTHLPGLRTVAQFPLAMGRARWQGEPVAAVVAASRAEAEDGLELIQIEYSELPPVTGEAAALEPGAPAIHSELGDNVCFERTVDEGDVDAAFAAAEAVAEEDYIFNRHTGVTMETRAIIADFNPGDDALTVYSSTQVPHQLQALLAKHFGLDEHKVRVICKNVGGAFGMKAHIYGDEFAAVALAIMLKRPVKYTPDRLESFTADLHVRGFKAKAKMAVDKDGKITAFEMDTLAGIGLFSMAPRSSIIETNQVLNLSGGCYPIRNYRARGRIAFQTLAMTSGYRGVGHPLAMAITEGLVELAAAKLGLDPLEIRRRNLIADDAYPVKSVTAMPFEQLSHQAALAKLEAMIGYGDLRADQTKQREHGIYRGIGFCSLIELSSPSPMFYGAGGAPISAQDGCTIRLDAKGNITCSSGVTEQGQGAEAVMAQVAATAFGVTPDKVQVITGDTHVTPYGGGTWGSRGTGIAGEAANKAARALRENVLDVAGVMLQAEPKSLDIRANMVVDAADGNERLSLAEIGRVVYYRADTLPKDFQSELTVTRHHVPKKYPFSFTNGCHAAHIEVDVNTGLIQVLKYWVVEDCGTVINPMLVDEQIRGGVAHGIGETLFEECIYNEAGQLLNGNMADYLVPMATELPDVEVAHLVSPTDDSELGAKGAGEAGASGAPAAIMNAINDALRPFGATVNHFPFTPERILKALGKI